jgi:uracil-DNA glycosylase
MSTPESSTSIHQSYADLVARRKSCTLCLKLTNPSKLNEGTFDSDQIGPWTLWQGNLGATCMVIGQDWGDTKYFLDNRGHEAPNNPTNTTLRNLLAIAGININPPSAEKAPGGPLFFTNSILCLKQGGMQAAVQSAWFDQCGSNFLKPTIDLVAPRLVITLGERAYRAVCRAHSLRPQPFRRAVDDEPTKLPSGALLVPVYHCGARILNTHRSLAKQQSDWARVGTVLSKMAPSL